MKNIIDRINWKRLDILLGIIVIVVLFVVFSKPSDKAEIEPEETKIKKTVETISFGNWEPNGRRQVLSTVESAGDIDILAEVNGTIGGVLVSIGDRVEKGQLLAKFKQTNDATQISYENALTSLQSTRASAKNGVLSAEISLDTARRSLEQTKNSEDQTYSQTYDTLRTRTFNSQTVLQQSIDWADRMLGASNFKYEVDFSRGQVGSNNTILKQNLKNKVEGLVRARNNFQTPKTDSSGDILWFAERNLGLLKQTQLVVRDLDTLIRQTPIHASFIATTRDTYQAQSEGFSAKVDGEVYALESQIEAAKSSSERNELSLIGAENQVKNSEAALELAQANANAQVAGAESQYRLASNAQNDLKVYAPFEGTISAEFINEYDQVNRGMKLFSLVSDSTETEVVGYVTSEEIHRIEAHPEEIKIRLDNGSIINPISSSLSSKIDPITQKMEVRFTITDPCNEESKGCNPLSIGSLARIILPAKNGVSTLLPISSISFEPDGAEVFIVEDGKIVRKKVITGKIVSDSLEVVDGLEIDVDVVTYRKRVHAGEEVELKVQN